MDDFARLHVRPYELLCLICRRGRADTPVPAAADRLAELAAAIRRDPGQPVTVRANADGVYRYQNPGRANDTPEGALFNEWRDQQILHRLGLVPGATRPARELLDRVLKEIASARDVCGGAADAPVAWRGCPRAASGAYEQGRALGLAVHVPPRPAAELAVAKQESAAAVLAARPLRLRPHHLMCMACFHGGRTDPAPIADDNLAEALAVIAGDPEYPVELVRGCCQICPPCPSYDPASNVCTSASGMSLRDQKKDLDLLRLLGLQYGDVRPARELYTRIFAAVDSTQRICGHGDGIKRAREWFGCGATGNDGYTKARACNLHMKGTA